MSENFRRFWAARGGPDAFERWRRTGKIPVLHVRVVGPDFVAGFSISDKVFDCAPILRKHLDGKSESQARAVIQEKGWKASIIRVDR